MSPTQPVCLITGASGGIGAALAHEFAKGGHALVLTARRPAQLEVLADDIVAAGFARPQVILADLAQSDGPDKLARELETRGLEPTFIVNNAGFGMLGEAAELEEADQLAMIDLNVRALTDLSLRWLDSLKRHRGGILNVASTAAFLPGHGMAIYHATKAFVLSFTEALHAELSEDGVRVCALCPGPVETEFYGRAGVPSGYFPAYLTRTAERVGREGYAGFMAGHRVVVPGTANRILTLLPRLLPRRAVLVLTRRRWNRGGRAGL
jgi:short-subunit dehydrogenase